MKNLTIKDAFKALDEIQDETIYDRDSLMEEYRKEQRKIQLQESRKIAKDKKSLKENKTTVKGKKSLKESLPLKEEVQDEAYEIAEYILEKINGKEEIGYQEFVDLFDDAINELYDNVNIETSPVIINGKEFDLSDLDTDVRGILGYSGWATVYEGDNEGGLTTKDIEESCKEGCNKEEGCGDKEDKQPLKEEEKGNEIDVEKLAQFLQGCKEEGLDFDGTSWFELDGDLAVSVGWLPGYDPKDNEQFGDIVDENGYGLCYEITENPQGQQAIDFEYLMMPYAEEGDVYSIGSDFNKDEDCTKLAQDLVDEYKYIREQLDNGKLIIESCGKKTKFKIKRAVRESKEKLTEKVDNTYQAGNVVATTEHRYTPMRNYLYVNLTVNGQTYRGKQSWINRTWEVFFGQGALLNAIHKSGLVTDEQYMSLYEKNTSFQGTLNMFAEMINGEKKEESIKEVYEPISSFKDFTFIGKTNQGWEIKKVYKDLDDDRMHVVVYRPKRNDYAVGLGYSPESGNWNQGWYDYVNIEDAISDLKKKYNVEEYEIKESCKVEENTKPKRTSNKKLTEAEKIDISDEEEVEKGKEIIKDNQEPSKEDNVEQIVDVDAETIDQLKDSYVGNAILQCGVCRTMIYKKPDLLVRDTDNEELWNVGEKCPHCGSEDGYELVGQVATMDVDANAEDQATTGKDDLSQDDKATDAQAPVDAPVENEFEEEEEDITFESFNVDKFNKLANKYLTSLYENVESFETTNATINDAEGKLMVEGIIKYKNNKTKNTQFIFEAKNKIKDKYLFEGYNETFSNKKNAFSLRTSIKDNTLITESLKYTYSIETLNESKLVKGKVTSK